MKPCANLQGPRCVEPRAAKVYGLFPPQGACRVCPFYKGPFRGFGDIVARVVEWLPFARRMKGCGSCAKRQAALNRMVPMNIPTNCGKCGKSAKEP